MAGSVLVLSLLLLFFGCIRRGQPKCIEMRVGEEQNQSTSIQQKERKKDKEKKRMMKKKMKRPKEMFIRYIMGLCNQFYVFFFRLPFSPHFPKG